ncbi:Uncharacterized membrane protein [Bradyrhizobium erythrophlei]|nr:Uncharacterized membrane protein [Bradyrhizobium erythrophlei]
MSSVEVRSELTGVNKTLPTIAWALCLVGAWPIGLIIAYVDRSKTTEVYASHYSYLIRTIWIGMLFGFVSLLLSVIAIGFFTWIATAIWYLVRCVKGLVLLVRDEPISNPGTWLV